jgi:hypothetical protein
MLRRKLPTQTLSTYARLSCLVSPQRPLSRSYMTYAEKASVKEEPALAVNVASESYAHDSRFYNNGIFQTLFRYPRPDHLSDKEQQLRPGQKLSTPRPR